jgi:DNA-binding transcriptional LysR family regulator
VEAFTTTTFVATHSLRLGRGPAERSTRDYNAPVPAYAGLVRPRPMRTQVTDMENSQTEPVRLPAADTQAPRGLELRHLRYFVAVADAGTFTRAAERLFIAQPTVSQQIRRLEQIVGTPLLHRRRNGVRLTTAGTALLEAARDVLSTVDRTVSQARQAAGLGRLRLRFVLPADLPDSLAIQTTLRLRSAADAGEVAITWLEAVLDAEFSPIRQRRADAGLGWLTASPDALPAPLEAMSLAELEPDVWIPFAHPAARRGVIGLDELAGLDVIHGPRRASPVTYDRWLGVLQAVDPRFGFTDPPFRCSLPMALAFAATADRPTAVLTGPPGIAEIPPGRIRLPRPAGPGDMARIWIARHPLTATAALVWNGDLPCPLQQLLFNTADGVTPPPASPPPAVARQGQQFATEPMSGGTSACAGSWNLAEPGLQPAVTRDKSR